MPSLWTWEEKNKGLEGVSLLPEQDCTTVTTRGELVMNQLANTQPRLHVFVIRISYTHPHVFVYPSAPHTRLTALVLSYLQPCGPSFPTHLDAVVGKRRSFGASKAHPTVWGPHPSRYARALTPAAWRTLGDPALPLAVCHPWRVTHLDAVGGKF